MKTHLGLAAVLAAALCGGGGPADALAQPEPQPVSVSVERAPTRIDFLAGKLLIARYEFGPDTAKPYFWPLNAPDGKPITRAWPMEKGYAGAQDDHVHQKSAWFCHGDVIPEGIEIKQKIRGVEGVDFWSEARGHGRIVVTKVGDVDQSKNRARVVTSNEWLTGDGQKILDETRVITVYNFGASDLIVLDIDLHASVCPITFGDTKEGSLGVRVRESVTEKVGKGMLTNAEGHRGEGEKDNKDKKGCWGVLSAWCDYSGPVENDLAGVAIFADPDNPYPTAWHARGYGLLAANPFGRAKSGFPALAGKSDLVKLAKGDHLKLRYGIFLHLGDAKSGKVAEAYEEFKKLKGK